MCYGQKNILRAYTFQVILFYSYNFFQIFEKNVQVPFQKFEKLTFDQPLRTWCEKIISPNTQWYFQL
jgi:hypothetical protein